MEEFIVNQIKYGLKYVPVNILKSFFKPLANDETRAAREKGFILGVCHPNESYDLLAEAGIEWVRFDIPFPFDADGKESESYLGFKERCRGYVDRGFKVMAVTPFPDAFVNAGIDPRTPEGEEKVLGVARFLATDLQGFVGGFQISNEAGMPRFTLPLTLDETARFIGIQAREMYPLRGDIIIGYNSAGPEAKLNMLMREYLPWCDYVGIDIYLGCFNGVPGLLGIFYLLVRYLFAFTGKPVILQEFGYISKGKPKSKKEKKELLRSYGIEREKDAKPIIEEFMTRLPDTFRRFIERDGKNDPSRYYDLLFRSDHTQHFYKEISAITKIPGYEHTPEGQAKFFDKLIEKLYKMPCVAGTVIYCWEDSERCYVCGQPDCPVETGWGLVDGRGEPKPSFYAVKKRFGIIKEREKRSGGPSNG